MATLRVAADETRTDTSPRRRRWIPLSLRMLVALLAILSAAFAWVGMRGYRQLAAIHEIERVGGTITSTPQGNAWLRERLGDDWARMFDEVTEITLINDRATDDTLRHVGRLRGLKLLYLGETPVTDEGLAHLKSLAELTLLDLNDTHITDTGLGHLRGLTQMEWLFLESTAVTDAGLAHLRGMTKLELLRLDYTQVSDAGLVHLKGMTQLQDLYLGNTKVSAVGVAELQRALPNLSIATQTIRL